ncbi:hypothetical protein PHMEG_00039169 [Phytophthora megakarya]|uniref:Uncharacterized protein n=1 Tax=Phytophthora megakarya TaxID=4795 RepID=A0A225UIQ0_9STRA|nr:hypothetical protein PHMEG_00039169 [Phytophthora megakarya]
MATATRWKATDTDQLHYPIYGEYYTGSGVTVDRTFTTTVEIWDMAYISDRCETPLSIQYRVFWAHPDRSSKNLYLKTWEPAVKLREDGFADEMDLVDRWKASSVAVFEDFWKEDEVGMGLFGADDDNLCVFNALKRTAELLGRPDLVTKQEIDQFDDNRHALYSQDLRAGATWVDVRDFVMHL